MLTILSYLWVIRKASRSQTSANAHLLIQYDFRAHHKLGLSSILTHKNNNKQTTKILFLGLYKPTNASTNEHTETASDHTQYKGASLPNPFFHMTARMSFLEYCATILYKNPHDL